MFSIFEIPYGILYILFIFIIQIGILIKFIPIPEFSWFKKMQIKFKKINRNQEDDWLLTVEEDEGQLNQVIFITI